MRKKRLTKSRKRELKESRKIKKALSDEREKRIEMLSRIVARTEEVTREGVELELSRV